MKLRAIGVSVAVAAALSVLPAAAKVSQADADRLGKDLTPVGAEMAGNTDGTIPAWDGGLPQKGTLTPDWENFPDPYPNEQPLYTITKANMAQYRDKLTVG